MNFDSYDVPPISEGSHMEPNFTFPSFEELYDTVVVKKALNNSKKIDIITCKTKQVVVE